MMRLIDNIKALQHTESETGSLLGKQIGGDGSGKQLRTGQRNGYHHTQNNNHLSIY